VAADVSSDAIDESLATPSSAAAARQTADELSASLRRGKHAPLAARAAGVTPAAPESFAQVTLSSSGVAALSPRSAPLGSVHAIESPTRSAGERSPSAGAQVPTYAAASSARAPQRVRFAAAVAIGMLIVSLLWALLRR
jgi:hypothetical protein